MSDLLQNTPFLFATLGMYLLVAACLWRIAAKTKEEPGWYAFVPLLNLVLFMRVSGKPGWWAILMFVPLANIVVGVMAVMKLSERFGLSPWYGLLALVSPLNLFLLLYLAFSSASARALPPPPRPVVPDIAPPSPPGTFS